MGYRNLNSDYYADLARKRFWLVYFDRVISKTYTKATIPFKQFASEKKEEKTTHEYSYTNSSKRKSLVVTFADGSRKVNEWSYDKLGRLEKIKDNGQEVVYKYDEKSRLSEK
ncbi:MAG: hypothetical protein WCV79_04470, partial [Candidatus Paceibacterota bacterium]